MCQASAPTRRQVTRHLYWSTPTAVTCVTSITPPSSNSGAAKESWQMPLLACNICIQPLLCIKPENIFSHVVNGELHGVLGDFGLALGLSKHRYKVVNATRGTPGYIAPKLLSGNRHADTSCDIYSLGMAALLCMLCSKSNPRLEEAAIGPWAHELAATSRTKQRAVLEGKVNECAMEWPSSFQAPQSRQRAAVVLECYVLGCIRPDMQEVLYQPSCSCPSRARTD